MTVQRRPYTDADLPSLQDALARWRYEAGACGYCHVGDLPYRLYGLRSRHTLGELVHVWTDGPTVIGITVAFRYDTTFDVFTAPHLRGTGTELDMLRSAYETTHRRMAETGTGHQPAGTDVVDCDRVRAELLGRLGFVKFRTWDHLTERDLPDDPADLPEPRLPDGFTIRSATMDDHEQLAEVRRHSFTREWAPGQYRGEVMRQPGYDPDREILAVAPDGQVAALTIIWLDELNKVGRFEPVATHRAFHRRGLARAVMVYGMREMRRAGMRTASVDHDATNVAARTLYEGLGFTKKYETYGFHCVPG